MTKVNEDFEFDIRIVEHRRRNNFADEAATRKYLKDLPDSESVAEDITVELEEEEGNQPEATRGLAFTSAEVDTTND